MEIYGYRVIIQKPYQKISVSSEVQMSDEFRKEMNDYLAANFGYDEVIEDGQIIKCEPTKFMAMNQSTFDKIKRELKAEELRQFRERLDYDVAHAVHVPFRFL